MVDANPDKSSSSKESTATAKGLTGSGAGVAALVAAEAAARQRSLVVTPPAKPKPWARPQFKRPKLTPAQVAAELKTLRDHAQAEEVVKRVAECGLPPTLREADKLDASTLPADIREVWAAARRLVTNYAGQRSIVALIGLQGTGKTTLAASIVLEEIKAGRLARYTTAWAYLSEIAATQKFSSQTTAKKVEAFYCRAPLLIIDEMQMQVASEFNTLTVQQLILARWNTGNATVLLGNDSPDSFEDRVGPLVISRMCECGDSFVFEYPDLRKRFTRR